jgi:squalene-hopene/tetraprenyl-beta-curcumene cyclase
MNQPTLQIRLCAIALVSIATCISSRVFSQSAPPADGATANKKLLHPPQRELDPRIKSQKITESEELPPLPQRMVAPLPPVHRISERAEQVPMDAETWSRGREAITRGLQFLESKADARGGWARDAKAAPTDQPGRMAPVALAVSSLVVKAFVQGDAKALERDSVSRTLRLIREAQQADGSFDNGPIANYVSASVLQALAAVGDQDDEPLRFSTIKWLQNNQWDQSEGLSAKQDWFGGAGYGNSGRPDMSNTQMMLDALYDAGLSPDEPAFQRALIFASRTQNLKATNSSSWAQSGPNDGGFIYTPANGGESMASEAAGEGRTAEKLPTGAPRSLRSYGSMTYAGFKSMLYAGLSQDDVRVRAAFDWLRHHWTFDENPGMGQQGLFYYYHTLARALLVAQQNEITDISGVKHNWREELITALLKRQAADGSWVNEADRWMEGDPVLVTAYAVLALEEALKPVR